MKAYLYILLISLMACQKGSDAPAVHAPGSAEKPVFRYLALGDSYTIGTAIGVQNSYAPLALDSLQQQDTTHKMELRVIAKNGWTTLALQQAMEADTDKEEYDAVSLLIGVNDQFSGQSTAQYKQHFIQNIKTALTYAGEDTTKLFVISIPDYGVTPYGRANNGNQISAAIDAFNAVNKSVADSLGISYINITSISRQAATQPHLVASDGLHFSTAMHRLWRPLVYARLEELKAQ